MPRFNETVNAAAQREVERALTELFGRPVTSVAGYAMEPIEPKRGRLEGLLTSFLRIPCIHAWNKDFSRYAFTIQPSNSSPMPTRAQEPAEEIKPATNNGTVIYDKWCGFCNTHFQIQPTL
ncbi:MAG: hypothetical protein QM730_15290 [Anaerolineales bacterium]